MEVHHERSDFQPEDIITLYYNGLWGCKENLSLVLYGLSREGCFDLQEE